MTQQDSQVIAREGIQILGIPQSSSLQNDVLGWYVLPSIIIQTIVITVFKILFRIFFKYSVYGLDNIKNLPQGVIFATNHSSELDPVIVPVSLPYLSRFIPFFYVSREKKFYIYSGWKKVWYGGLLFRLMGAYQVYTGKENYEFALVNHIKILNENHSICIFPEGRKTQTGEIGEAKGGVGYLAYRTGKPIIPVAISGLFKLSFKDFLFARRRIIVTFGKPIFPKELFPNPNSVSLVRGQDDCKTAATIVMQKIDIMLAEQKGF